jgi:hypothetical protein
MNRADLIIGGLSLLCLLIAIVIARKGLCPPSFIIQQGTTERATTIDECERQKRVQFEDQIPNDPSDPSIFNCHSKLGKCNYFRPQHFFHACGKGSSYAPLLHEMNRDREAASLWKDMPPIVMPYLRLTPDMLMKSTGKSFAKINLSMIHVHKCGGSSLVTSFRDLKLKNEDELDSSEYKGLMTVYQQKRSAETNAKSWRQIESFLDDAVLYQSPDGWDDSNHMIIAVVRDPAERFISAVGHVTNDKIDAGNELKKECLKETVSETLDCFVNLIKDRGFLIDLHFTPMVLEIAFATMGKDLPVGIFNMSDLPLILEEIGAMNPYRRRKDGKKAGYRPAILLNATLSDYGKNTFSALCEIYEMDVIFLRQLGLRTSCDDFFAD